MDKVTVHTLSDTLAHEGRAVLHFSIDYPRMAGDSPVEKRLNRDFNARVAVFEGQMKGRYFRQAVHQLAALGPHGGFVPLSITASVQVMLSGPQLLSLFADTWYQLGQSGSHLARSARTVRLGSGADVTLPRLFVRGYDFRPVLNRSLHAQIAREAALNPGTFFANWPHLATENGGNRGFYLTDDSMVIFFQQQAIAEKIAGLPAFRVPYSLFEEKLHFGLH